MRSYGFLRAFTLKLSKISLCEEDESAIESCNITYISIFKLIVVRIQRISFSIVNPQSCRCNNMSVQLTEGLDKQAPHIMALSV